MLISVRGLLLGVSILVTVAGTIAMIVLSADLRWVGLIMALSGLLGAALLVFFSSPWRAPLHEETDRIHELSEERLRELMRGTSLYLREMHYRYSVRQPARESADHRCFTAEVNTIRLGFVPAVITDNTNDRQGKGYVAFVYDGKRWRGPGLPCPGRQHDAVRHAAKCVSPLSTEEETQF